MNKMKLFAALLTASAAFASCSGKNNLGSASVSQEETAASEIVTENVTEADAEEKTIYWLADYDLNPAEGESRYPALCLFEDCCGGKVEYIRADADSKYDTLSQRILSGQPVDMFPYEPEYFPAGALNKVFQPLDSYYDTLEMDSDMWSDMADLTERFAVGGEHFVIPYRLSDPVIVTYSRKMIKDEKLDDPKTLYDNGLWDWNAMKNMMSKFVENADGVPRYGISGQYGKAVLQSTGHNVVSYENGTFNNNINDPAIEKAEQWMADIYAGNLFNSGWTSCFPDDGSTLFFVSGDWTLPVSNVSAEEGADLMVVPFPKFPHTSENYIGCNVSAKMLAAGSQNAAAVAEYIKCERIAETSEGYRNAAREQAVKVEKGVAGELKSFITEEQYDAIQGYLYSGTSVPAVDFSYGMGTEMNGVMDKAENTFAEGSSEYNSWSELRNVLAATINSQVEKYGGQTVEVPTAPPPTEASS